MGTIETKADRDSLISDIQAKISELTPQFSMAIIDIADIYQFNMQSISPVRSGEMQRNIAVYSTGQFDREIYSDVPQWDWVILGTKPHLIEPLHPKDALYWPGAPHPVAVVHHPGTSPNDFPQDAFDMSDGQVESRGNELLEWLVG